MKRIILIGDSTMFGSDISSGYSPFVREHLEGRAEVITPIENCQDTRFTLSCLDELFDPAVLAEADVIHWNNGLWDVMHFVGSARCVVPLAKYTELVGRIYEKLREVNRSARIVFATTIPVVEAYALGASYRKNEEIAEYNRAVCELFSEKDVIINDLHAIAAAFDESAWLPDGVHLSDAHSGILAEQVARVIEGLL